MYQKHLEWDIHSCSGGLHTFHELHVGQKLIYLQIFSKFIAINDARNCIGHNPVHNTIFST